MKIRVISLRRQALFWLPQTLGSFSYHSSSPTPHYSPSPTQSVAHSNLPLNDENPATWSSFTIPLSPGNV